MPTKRSAAVMIKSEPPVLVNAGFEAPATVRDDDRPVWRSGSNTVLWTQGGDGLPHRRPGGVPPGCPEALPLNRCTVTRNVKPLYSSEATLINMSYL